MSRSWILPACIRSPDVMGGPERGSSCRHAAICSAAVVATAVTAGTASLAERWRRRLFPPTDTTEAAEDISTARGVVSPRREPPRLLRSVTAALASLTPSLQLRPAVRELASWRQHGAAWTEPPRPCVTCQTAAWRVPSLPIPVSRAEGAAAARTPPPVQLSQEGQRLLASAVTPDSGPPPASPNCCKCYHVPLFVLCMSTVEARAIQIQRF